MLEVTSGDQIGIGKTSKDEKIKRGLNAPSDTLYKLEKIGPKNVTFIDIDKIKNY